MLQRAPSAPRHRSDAIADVAKFATTGVLQPENSTAPLVADNDRLRLRITRAADGHWQLPDAPSARIMDAETILHQRDGVLPSAGSW